jgi:hypothetical protein
VKVDDATWKLREQTARNDLAKVSEKYAITLQCKERSHALWITNLRDLTQGKPTLCGPSADRGGRQSAAATSGTGGSSNDGDNANLSIVGKRSKRRYGKRPAPDQEKS